MKVLIFCILLVTDSVNEKYSCPTNDGVFVGRDTRKESIPTGRFGANMFKINSDLEIKSLTAGLLKTEKENNGYKVSVINEDSEIVYFLVDSVYAEKEEYVGAGQVIGSVKTNSIIAVKILVNGKHIVPVFSCDNE